MSPFERRRPFRWKIAAFIVLMALGALAWVWNTEVSSFQTRTMRTGALVAITFLLLLLWWLLLSGLSWKVRVLGVLLLGGILLSLRTLVRFEGVDGNLVPILAWRWSPMGATQPPQESGESASVSSQTNARDYPQFLGPNRDARLAGPALAQDWESRPPRALWKQAVGAGWSAFAIAGELAITQEQRGDQEMVIAYALKTGQAIWSHSDEIRYESPIAGIGPRATPTISDGWVYTLGAEGLLSAFDLETGGLHWQRSIEEDHRVRTPVWGRSSSPLIVGELVVVTAGAGRTLVAYEKESGRPAWKGGSDPISYASPTLARILGQPQILIVSELSLTGHDPRDGSVLWRQEWPGRINCSQPLPLPGDRVLVSAGYGVGAKLFRISSTNDGTMESEAVWESTLLKTKFTNAVYHQGALYGLDDGILACVDSADGKRLWKRGRYGHGQVVLVGNLLLITSEKGQVALVEASPDRFMEVARFQALEGKTWNPPALAGNLLLIRNDKEAAAFELPLQQGSSQRF